LTADAGALFSRTISCELAVSLGMLPLYLVVAKQEPAACSKSCSR
jgi:hypothetical protein